MKSNFLEKLASSIIIQATKKLVQRILKNEKVIATSPKADKLQELKSHPWRLCPIGQHWVRTHPMKVPESNNNPNGMTSRDGHCANNPERNKEVILDYIAPEEMHLIANTYFDSLGGAPKNDNLNFENGNKYDSLIRGWTQYLNDIFKPDVLLDPDLVEALIASESGFNPNPKAPNAGGAGKARGLIQLTDQAIKALSDPNGELKNQFIKMTRDETSDPNLSIAAGTRWLFRKKRLVSGKLGREATWEETIGDYKGYWDDIKSGEYLNSRGMKNIIINYERLKK